ncbi:alkanesulfonate monooxygenase [Flavobacterium sp. DGU38]|uniref:Alkanesulfonate monooxygenase n=1 Tax=Flavobacterium calami TaxID=3139144 RepID=A0ABU9IKS2_9FLAO
MFIIAAIAYAFSIFIDVSVYHFKYYIQDDKNIRHLFSMINIFQYSARFFILIFTPIMAYLTESVKDRNEVWFVTLLSHFFVVLFLLPLYSYRFSSCFSKRIINILNLFFGKSKPLKLTYIEKQKYLQKPFIWSDFYLFLTNYIAGFLFSISITFLYFISFYYPQKALMLSSGTQIINMFGSMLLILFIDPKIMGAIDDGRGHQEITILTTSRILVHITLILILLSIR